MIRLEESFIIDKQEKADNLPLDMVWIEPGEIILGHERFANIYEDEGSLWWQAPLFSTNISQGFWMAKYPATNAHWSNILDGKILQNPNWPRIKVTWLEAMTFCQKLNQLYADKLPQGYHFSLPTELHWEYACRAGTDTLNYLSNEKVDLPKIAQIHLYEDQDTLRYKLLSSEPVGQKQPNVFGLHDMLGGALEWCFDIVTDYPLGEDFEAMDWMGQRYEGYWAAEMNPLSPKTYRGTSRILRGGMYSTFRWYTGVSNNSFGIRGEFGFRVCLRPITKWDLNDPILKKYNINMIG